MAEENEPGHETGRSERPVPRDLPDQQARPDDDPWETTSSGGAPRQGEDVPDTDEAGSGPAGNPRSGTARPEHPAPQEPAD
ncbi:hypothetical protein NX794_30440 [Streptomyces sp. LP11]|uniref:Uncharacterized protein n=1 Tax=Streptomyces pyxinicus TaxID=2970331 RepID=A0ABT2BBR7_9ACTN|nr:hypothetical protein [Streptomyces sp. LP11]MCS0605490.1 hypothetical protein [Streptomyces sp. LP11]